MLTVTLPWPGKDLSPNGGGRSWQKKHRVKKAYKRDCWADLKAQKVGRIDAERLSVSLTFCPPHVRGYDEDNLVARMKAGLDALSDALGVDDSRFSLSQRIAEPCRPHGKVIVTVEAI